VFFQDGVAQSAINEYRPHCELAVRKLVDRPQTIYADYFTVDRVSSDIVRVVASEGVVVALSADIQLASGDGGGDGEGRLMKIYTLYLHSDRQLDVLSLVCGGAFNSPALAARPTLQDIATALGAMRRFNCIEPVPQAAGQPADDHGSRAPHQPAWRSAPIEA
jgi:hypothetical protein